MKKPLHTTGRCLLFETIADKIWGRLTDAHSVGVDLMEIGITADILVEILLHSKNATPNFDVYARNSRNENTFGSDIDVFIETDPNKYRWFALQAKVLKMNNRYNTFRDSSDGIMQWEKLSLLENVSGCKGYYLLYNGRDAFRHNGKDVCNRDFSELQFGCSLVEPNEIERLANLRNGRGYISPRFEDIHPGLAQPWRCLVCCYLDKEGFELYDENQILTSQVGFYKLGEENNNEENENDRPQIFQDQDGNPITYANEEAGWQPHLRIIVKRTT